MVRDKAVIKYTRALAARPGALTPHWPSNRPYLYPPASETLLLFPLVGLYAFCLIGDGVVPTRLLSLILNIL